MMEWKGASSTTQHLRGNLGSKLASSCLLISQFPFGNGKGPQSHRSLYYLHMPLYGYQSMAGPCSRQDASPNVVMFWRPGPMAPRPSNKEGGGGVGTVQTLYIAAGAIRVRRRRRWRCRCDRDIWRASRVFLFFYRLMWMGFGCGHGVLLIDQRDPFKRPQSELAGVEALCACNRPNWHM